MFDFLKQQNNGFAMDISDSSLKIIKLERSGNLSKIVSFGKFAMPEGLLQEGEILQTKTLADFISQSLSKIKGRPLKNKEVAICLPEEKSFLDVLQIPQLDKNEISQIILSEAENRIPFNINDVYIDYQDIPCFNEEKQGQEVLLAACPKSIVDRYIEVLKMINLRPIIFELQSTAIVRALSYEKEANSFLVVDLGQKRTNLMLVCNQVLRFSSFIPFSSGFLNSILSEKLGIGDREAEEMKMKEGLEGRREIFNVLSSCLTDLSSQIKRHLDYFQTHTDYSLSPVEKIILCGGGAKLRGIRDFVFSKLKIPVEKARVWENVIDNNRLKEIKEEYGSGVEWADALGLAMAAIDRPIIKKTSNGNKEQKKKHPITTIQKKKSKKERIKIN